MEIIQATEKDFETVKHIVHTTIKTIYPHYYPSGVVKFFLNHHSDENIKNALEEEIVLLLFVDGNAVGTGSIHKNEVGRLFVLPEFQGKGYGTILMDEIECRVSKNYTQAELSASLPAFKLYLKRGYQPSSYEEIITENQDILTYTMMVKCF